MGRNGAWYEYVLSTYFLETYITTITAHDNNGLQQQRTTDNLPF